MGGRTTRAAAKQSFPLRIRATAGRDELAHPCALNTGAFPLSLPALLAVLDGALSHLARASLLLDYFSVPSRFTVCENGRPQGGLLQVSATACLWERTLCATERSEGVASTASAVAQ